MADGKNIYDLLIALVGPAAALGGVWFSNRLTNGREAKKEAERVSRETTYLAVLAAAHLDRFAQGCLDVAYDEGENNPNDPSDWRYRCSSPTFSPLDLNVDWKVLPKDLMERLLSLPALQEQLETQLRGAGENLAPWEWEELIDPRRRGYAELGLLADQLRARLRDVASLGSSEPPRAGDHWTREQALRYAIESIRKREAEVASSIADQHAASLAAREASADGSVVNM